MIPSVDDVVTEYEKRYYKYPEDVSQEDYYSSIIYVLHRIFEEPVREKRCRPRHIRSFFLRQFKKNANLVEEFFEHSPFYIDMTCSYAHVMLNLWQASVN